MSSTDRVLRRAFLPVLLTLVAAVACDGSSSGQGSPDTNAEPVEPARYAIVEGCAETFCDAKMATANAQCEQCTHSCVRSACDYSSCSSFCKGTPCTTGDDACRRTGLVARTGPSDAAVFVACEKYEKHVWACFGDEFERGNCAAYARVERPEVAAWYECFAKLSCSDMREGDDPCSRGDGYPIGTLLCDGFEARPAWLHCSPEMRAQLDRDGEWLRDDVREAGLACLELEQDIEVAQCFTVWWNSLGNAP